MRRKTVQRALILGAVQTMDHPTAEEIFCRVTADFPAISKGTVYRNLGRLVELGRLRRVSAPGLPDHFDTTLQAHYHASCKCCGKVADIPLPYQSDLLKNIPDTGGFLIEEHDIVLRGYCPACRAKPDPIKSV